MAKLRMAGVAEACVEGARRVADEGADGFFTAADLRGADSDILWLFRDDDEWLAPYEWPADLRCLALCFAAAVAQSRARA
jgi:hypothetical protein